MSGTIERAYRPTPRTLNMPVPRLQKRVEEVKYVVVERTEEGKAQEVDRLAVTATATPTSIVSPRQDHPGPRPTVLQIRDDDDDDQNDGDRQPEMVCEGP